jgi:hypothetical protein
VHVRPAAGANVTIEMLDVTAKHVVVSGVTISRDFYVNCGADDVTLRDAKAGLWFVTSARNVNLVNTEVGPMANAYSAIRRGECGLPVENVLIDRVYMHDNDTDPFNSSHMECLTVQTVDGLTIRNSRFYHC